MKHYSVTEVAALLSVRRQAVLAAIRRGDIAAEKVGNAYIVAEGEMAKLSFRSENGATRRPRLPRSSKPGQEGTP